MDFQIAINELIKHMESTTWTIHDFVTEPDLKEYQKQDTNMATLPVEYVNQSGCGDYGHHGEIYFMTPYSNGDEGKLYLHISYYE